MRHDRPVPHDTDEFTVLRGVVLLLSLPLIGPGLARAERTERVLERLGFAGIYSINLARFQERSRGATVFKLQTALDAARCRAGK
jgi:hypothetical protein